MRMFSVAVVGPDGSGKTTICRRLGESLPLPTRYVYMGVSPDSSNLMLPTTRLLRAVKRRLGVPPDTHGPRDPRSVRAAPRHPLKRALWTGKSLLALANRAAEEWFRQGVTWYYQWRGHVVLFDRHYFPDYYSYDIAPTAEPKPLARRLHGAMLRHVFPKPGLMIYLDAPAEVLLARKGEGTAEVLEERRRAYLEMGQMVPHFAVIDATQPEDKVLADAQALILDFHARRAPSRRKTA